MEKVTKYVLISETKPGSKKTAGSLLYKDIGDFVSESGNYQELVLQDIPELEVYIARDWMGAIIFLLTKSRKLVGSLDKLIPYNATVLIMLRGWSHLILPSLIALKKRKHLQLVLYDSDGVRSELLRFKFAYPLILWTNKRCQRHFDFVWSASETLKHYYLKRSIKSEVLVKPIEGAVKIGRVRKDTRSGPQNPLSIFFAGNIYSKDQFYSFLKALSLYASANDMQIIMHVCSSDSIEKQIPNNLAIEHHGWVSSDQLDNIAGKCDFSYLPYPGQYYKRYYLKFAFPTKFGLYISKGLPVFYHGPQFRNFEMIERDNLGVSSDSKNPEKLLRKVTCLLTLLQQESVQEALQIASEAYTYSSFQQKVLQGIK